MPLNDTQIRAAKPREKTYKLSDGSGLQLHITPQGSKLWRFAYRIGKKQREYCIGKYPEITLLEARKIREQSRQLVKQGSDPVYEKRRAVAKAIVNSENTFGKNAADFIHKQEKEQKSSATITKNKWILFTVIPEDFRNTPIRDITPPHLLDVIRRVEAKGQYETAHRVKTVAGQVFRFAIACSRADHDISQHLNGALIEKQSKPRPAIFDPQELKGLLISMEGYAGSISTRYALRLAPLVFVRPIELRHWEWQEINFEDALWRLPAKKLKMRREHVVPLSKQALAILRELKAIGQSGEYVFPSTKSFKRPLSSNTLNAALRRLGYEKEEVCMHGFRRTASTLLNEQGYNFDWVERQLAHVEENKIRGVYNAAQYLTGRREMMQWWADKIDEIKGITI